jgi:hypothetical protein
VDDAVQYDGEFLLDVLPGDPLEFVSSLAVELDGHVRLAEAVADLDLGVLKRPPVRRVLVRTR